MKKVAKWLLIGIVIIVGFLAVSNFVQNIHDVSMSAYLEPGSNSQQKIVHDIVNTLPSLDGDRNQR